MKHVIALILCLLSFAGAQAQSARSVLDATAKAIRQGGNTEIRFTATTFQDTTPQETMAGTMWLDGRRYRLESAGLSIWFDGKTQWSYLHESNEVNITEPSEAEQQQLNPYAFLDLYKLGYKLSLKKTSLRGLQTFEIRMRDEKGKLPIQEIYLDVTRNDYTPLCVRVKQDGNWSRIALQNVQMHRSFPASQFTFQPSEHPDLEVVDLR